jgi:hypothetical protein
MLVYETGPFPFILATCFTEGDFQKAMEDLGVCRSFTNGDISTCHFLQQEGRLLALLCFNFPEDINHAHVAGRIVLELNRAIKELWDYIGECAPGDEVEGQFLKNYTTSIMAHWLERSPNVVVRKT